MSVKMLVVLEDEDVQWLEAQAKLLGLKNANEMARVHLRNQRIIGTKFDSLLNDMNDLFKSLGGHDDK